MINCLWKLNTQMKLIMQNRIDKLVETGMKDPAAFERELDALSQKIKTDKKLKNQLKKEWNDSLDRKGKEIDDLVIKVQLHLISDMINMSYIAKNYFGKSRQWLSHRINGAIVNRKPAQFTDKQVDIFNRALKDISKKIGSVSIYKH